MNYFEDIGFDQLPKYPVSLIFPTKTTGFETITSIDQQITIPSPERIDMSIPENRKSSKGIIVVFLIAIGILTVAYMTAKNSQSKREQ